jgi:hypothetical protein
LVDQAGKKGVVDGWHDQADGVRPLQLQTAGSMIDHVAIASNILFDNMLRRLADPVFLGLPIGDEPDGRYRKARPTRNLVNRLRHIALRPAS